MAQSEFERGIETGQRILKDILPVRIYKDYETGKIGEGLSPMFDLVCAFAKRELAEEFINYQATIDPKTKYIIRDENEKTEKEI